MKIGLLIVTIVLSACATTPRRERVYLGGSAFLTLPSPQEIQTPRRAVQIVTVEHNGMSKTFEAIFENDKNLLSVAVLSPMWPTPMKVTYDGTRIVASDMLKKMIPADFKYAVADMVLIYASNESMKKSLNSNAQIMTDSLQRKIIDVSSKQPRTIVEIKYENDNPFQGQVELKNFVRDYSLHIKTLKVE